jgi:hypothetical protein
MCKKGRKSIDHLLLHCEGARDLWVLVFCLFGMDTGHALKGWWSFWLVGEINLAATAKWKSGRWFPCA